MTRYTAHGKQVLVNGFHLADCITEEAARTIADALNGSAEPNPCAGIFDHKWLDAECVHAGCQSLFLAEAAKLLNALTVMARTSGGTAGPDEALMGACEAAENFLSLRPPRSNLTATTDRMAEQDGGRLLEQCEFLLARLETFEHCLLDDEPAREFFGHVSPAIARLRDSTDRMARRLGAEFVPFDTMGDT